MSSRSRVGLAVRLILPAEHHPQPQPRSNDPCPRVLPGLFQISLRKHDRLNVSAIADRVDNLRAVDKRLRQFVALCNPIVDVARGVDVPKGLRTTSVEARPRSLKERESDERNPETGAARKKMRNFHSLDTRVGAQRVIIAALRVVDLFQAQPKWEMSC